jgi:hypothetical protein
VYWSTPVGLVLVIVSIPTLIVGAHVLGLALLIVGLIAQALPERLAAGSLWTPVGSATK